MAFCVPLIDHKKELIQFKLQLVPDESLPCRKVNKDFFHISTKDLVDLFRTKGNFSLTEERAIYEQFSRECCGARCDIYEETICNLRLNADVVALNCLEPKGRS